MFDLKPTSLFFNAKFGAMVTIMVFTSACAHEIFITPANSPSTSYEESATTPEPLAPAEVSPLSETKSSTPTQAKRHRRVLAKRSHKVHKSARLAAHKVRHHKTKVSKAAAAIAAVEQMPAAPAQPIANVPGPEIAPPNLPAPLASAGVQTEIDGDSGSHWGLFTLYTLGILAVAAGLVYVAPRSRRAKPKRKLVYNG